MYPRFAFIFILNLVGAFAATLLTEHFLLQDSPRTLSRAVSWWVMMIAFYPAAASFSRLGSDKQTSKRKVSFVRWLVIWSLGAVAMFLIEYFGKMFYNEIVLKRLPALS